MLNLILAILCSVSVSVLLKVARQRNLTISQAIAFNYIVALSLCWFLLKPDFKGLEFTDFILQSESAPLFVALGLLLPSVFIIMAKAVELAGIVRADATQRLSLFLPVLAAFLLFSEALNLSKTLGIILAFIALFCLLNKPKQDNNVKAQGLFALLGVWFGYGIIDILFKQVAKSGGAFPTTLFISFALAGCVMFIYLLLKRTQWNTMSVLSGLLLGVLNFFNILFYIKAHQSFSTNPTFVFAGMNIGVICLGTVAGALVFKEKISKVNGVGIILGIGSVISLFYLQTLVA